MSRLSEVENVGPEEARELEDEFFARVFAGWEAGQISNGDEALEDTPENRAAVLSISEFRMALIAGYFKSFGGDAKKPSSFTR
ncbi:MAG: hypothetical protein KGV50_02605 [Gammaproteobacteria bacterium]|nr:hypothetical protein [Gammaproteobacteria bacterium]